VNAKAARNKSLMAIGALLAIPVWAEETLPTITAFDREIARRDGRGNLGGDIMIHGSRSSKHRQ
jgi:hypothetical protein